jgi:hypothetical protein
VDIFLSAFDLSDLSLPFNLGPRFLIVLRGYLSFHDSALFRIFIVLGSDFVDAALSIEALFFFICGKGFSLP